MKVENLKTSLLLVVSASALISGLTAWADPVVGKAKIPLDPNGKPYNYKASDFTKLHFSNVIPSNFIAPYPNCTSNTGMVNSTRGGHSATMAMTTKDAPDTVIKWYQDYLGRSQWAVRTPSSASMQKIGVQGKMAYLSATRERQNLSIVCAPQPKTAQTGINVSWFLR